MAPIDRRSPSQTPAAVRQSLDLGLQTVGDEIARERGGAQMRRGGYDTADRVFAASRAPRKEHAAISTMMRSREAGDLASLIVDAANAMAPTRQALAQGMAVGVSLERALPGYEDIKGLYFYVEPGQKDPKIGELDRAGGQFKQTGPAVSRGMDTTVLDAALTAVANSIGEDNSGIIKTAPRFAVTS